MPEFLKKITSLLSYKEPKNEELGFELLEGDNEGVEQDSTTQQEANDKQNSDAKPESDTGQQSDANQENGIGQQSDAEKRSSVQKKDSKQNQIKSGKQPFSVEEWNERRNTGNTDNEDTCQPVINSDFISTELCVNLKTIKGKFLMPKNQDITIREFKIGRQEKAFIIYMEGMVDKNTLNLAIFPKLMTKDVFDELGDDCPIDYLIENVIAIHSVRKTNKFSDAILQVLNGVSALFVEGCGDCILIETKGYEKRNVEQPVTETVVKGSQEGFTENLRTNVTLIRKIIKNENLVTEILPVGTTNHSNCVVMYLQGIANPKVVQEVIKRIKRINTDFMMGDGMLEQFIEDNSFMLFPQTLSTERPDRTDPSLWKAR